MTISLRLANLTWTYPEGKLVLLLRVGAVLYAIKLNKKRPANPPATLAVSTPCTSLPDVESEKKKVKFERSETTSSTSGPGTFDVTFYKTHGGTAPLKDAAVTVLALDTLKGVVEHVVQGGDGDMLNIATMSLVRSLLLRFALESSPFPSRTGSR